DAKQTVAAAEEKLAILAEQITAAGAELEKANGHVTVLRGEFASISNGMEEIQGQAEQHSKREHELSLSKNELSVRIETLIEHTKEKPQINLHETYAGYQQQEMDWDAVAAEINDLKGKISRLGNVNLDAIGEQSTLEERQASLAAQL